jgi:hypothetical protein
MEQCTPARSAQLRRAIPARRKLTKAYRSEHGLREGEKELSRRWRLRWCSVVAGTCVSGERAHGGGGEEPLGFAELRCGSEEDGEGLSGATDGAEAWEGESPMFGVGN